VPDQPTTIKPHQTQMPSHDPAQGEGPYYPSWRASDLHGLQPCLSADQAVAELEQRSKRNGSRAVASGQCKQRDLLQSPRPHPRVNKHLETTRVACALDEVEAETTQGRALSLSPSLSYSPSRSTYAIGPA